MSRTFPPGFKIPTSDPIYGMPTSFMTGFQNNTSTYTRPVTSTLSPLQGSGSGINHMARNNSQPIQIPVITINTQAVIRQQMDDNNHEMLGVLAQHMGTIFNHLIQSTTQTNLQNAQANQQMAA